VGLFERVLLRVLRKRLEASMVDSNPLMLQDVTIIIDTYTTPGKGEETTETDLSTMDRLRNTSLGNLYSFAMMEEKLQGYMDQSVGAINTFYGYSTDERGEPANLLGVEFKNTALTMSQSGSVLEAGATLLADCIPCKDRILALLSLNPLADLWDALDAMYDLQFKFITGLWDALTSGINMRNFSDLCSLIQFLNFQCVYDLNTMVQALSQLVAKYTFSLSDIKLTTQDLVAKVFGPGLAPLLATFDKWIQLIIAPIECVIDEVDKVLQRIDVMEGWQLAEGRTGTAEEAEGWFKRLDSEEISKGAATAMGFLTIRKYLQKAVDSVDEEYEKLNKDIADFIGAEDAANQEIFSISNNLERLSNLIGLLLAVKTAIQQKQSLCGTEEELEGFINTYVAPAVNIDIIAKDGKMQLSPSIPDELDGMKELLNIVGTYEKQVKIDTGTVIPTGPANIPVLHVPLNNCLYTVTDKELDVVREYLSTFE